MFNTLETARAASKALLSQVFVGVFDDVPLLTSGCGPSPASCKVYTPYEHYTSANGNYYVRCHPRLQFSN